MKIAGIAVAAFAVFSTMSVEAGSIKSKFTAAKSYTNSGGAASSTAPEINVTIKGGKGEVRSITITESGIDEYGDNYTRTEVITPGRGGYSSTITYSYTTPSGFTYSETYSNGGSGKVKASKKGKVSANLREFYSSSSSSPGGSSQSSVEGLMKINASKKVSYSSSQTSSYSDSFGGSSSSSTTTTGSGKAKGKL